MNKQVLAKTKPLYASILRNRIGEFLLSSEFKHFLLENNLDDFWERCRQIVRNKSSGVILISGYTGDVEKAFQYFLDSMYQSFPFNKFIETVFTLIIEWEEWKDENINKQKIIKALNSLGDPQIVAHKFNNSTEVEKINAEAIEFNTENMKIDTNLCFVLMPFSSELEPIYQDVIKEVVEKKLNLECIRADEIFGNLPIMEDIWEYIKKARILIADLTGRNPNVFYELGIAHALNKEVIMLTQDITDVPFDLKHIRCIEYKDSLKGSKKLIDNLEKSIKSVLFKD